MGKDIEFYWMMKDEVYAHIVVECDTRRVICTEYRKQTLEQFFGKRPHTIEYLYKIFESRCIDRNRPDLKDFLDYYGLKEYNAYEFCLKTHGVSTQDFFWIKWADETITWDDVKVRE